MSVSSAQHHTVSCDGDDEDIDDESCSVEDMQEVSNEDEEEALVDYFKVYLQPDASSDSDQRIAKATARVLMVKQQNAACLQNPAFMFFGGSQISQVCQPPSSRKLANQVIAAVLRNNSSLEDLHAGAGIDLQNTLGDARFSVAEVETLLSEAASGLGALLCSSYDRKGLGEFLSGTRLAPPGTTLPDTLLTLTMLRANFQHLSAEQQAAMVDGQCILHNIAVTLTCDSARDWDQGIRSGGLWVDSPTLAGHTRPCIQTGHTKPIFQEQLDSSSDRVVQDATYMQTTVTSWQIMRAVFLYTGFLRGPYLERPLAKGRSRLDDSEMKEMMIQATSNLEKIFEQQATLAPSDFDSWLDQL